MRLFHSILALCVLGVLFIGANGAVKAQDPGYQDPNAPQEVVTPQAPVDARKIPSLLFTYWEHAALIDMKLEAARNDNAVQRAPTEDEIARAMRETEQVEKPRPPPEQRELRLGGIVYTDSDDWTIWLNEQRIEPNALPEEIISLRVRRHYIDVKWYDDYTSQIYPIRLRAHQRFNLDTRIFLPG